ncbi:MAG: ATP-dependent helicase [Candidatus Saccharimonadales bacterium]
MSFKEGYKQLNAAQRQAVDTIEGPVLVVAGPGTGKTQLLSMRAANIVQKTDTAPNNILCLTFTESAAQAMRKRLISLMGPDGNKVAVHTFHSFGAEIINHYPEYFYNGARFSPADELASYEILREIFRTLPHNNPLAKTMNDEFTALKDTQRAISHLKRAGLLPDELLAVIEHNQAFCDFAEPHLAEAFAARFSKKDFPRFSGIAEQLAKFKSEPLELEFVKPLGELCSHEFTKAVGDAEASGKTTPLTTWRNRWLEKNRAGEFVFKDRTRAKKLRALAKIYKLYREKLIEHELFDFDDMVSMVAHTLETTPELRFNLQEQYLYLMVDEFQDTNGAQLRLLSALAENPVNEGRPNVLAVGDDDQAIYAFQGAELSNILDFTMRYSGTTIVTLTDNYRSTKPILSRAREVITQGEQRLETTLGHISKELTAHNTLVDRHPELHQFADPEAQYEWIATQIAERIKAGTLPNEIAVLARHHRQLVELLPYLHAANLKVNYERRSNVLESPHIRELITLAGVIVFLSEQRYDLVEALLPELLSYEFWNLKTSDLWQLSIDSYKQRRMWLEVMIESDGKLRQIAELLIVASHQALHEPLETMLDILIGSNESQLPNETDVDAEPPREHGPAEEFISPYRAHYFNGKRLQDNPNEYLTLLSNLRTIRQALADYHPGETLHLRDFVDFVELHKRTNTPIVDTAQHVDDVSGVELMTAHKAKGLEFDTVFVLSCQDEIWGRRARKPGSQLSFPYNMPIEPAGQRFDDSLRLFFVAMTRAKHHLLLTAYTHDSNGKESILAEFLHGLQPSLHEQNGTANIEHLTPGWQQRHLSLPKVKQEVLLKPVLEKYCLSATHLNNFLDVSRGGPQAFLLQNLLRFPQAMTPHQVFGHAIHAVLHRAQTHLSATGERRPMEDVLHDYDVQLQQARLSERDFMYLFEKGSDVLQTYLGARYDRFKPEHKAERSFAAQNVVIDGVRLTGAIDVMEIDETNKTITVVDYKTGKAFNSWRAGTDFEKIKLHKYKQQLMLYKLLVENSRDFSNYTVTRGVLEFIEADPDGQLHQLELTFTDEELVEFKQLLTAVWRHIQQLSFPDTSQYDPNSKGIQQFEKDLLLELTKA